MANLPYSPPHLRTLALVGHRSSGKTSLGDAVLQVAGAVRARGSVEEGSSLLDHEEEERRRGMTLGLAFAWVDWREHLVQVVDTPGSQELAHDRDLGLAAVDAALVVVHAVDGVELGTVRAFAAARARDLPVGVVVSRAERLVDPEALLSAVREAAGRPVVPLTWPFQDESGALAGVIDLLAGTALRFATDGSGRFSPEPLPRALALASGPWRDQLVEAVALTDDALLTEYLEFLDLPSERLAPALARAVRDGRLVPLWFASAERVVGVQPVLDGLVDLFPGPLDAPSALIDADGSAWAAREDGPFAARHVATRLDAEGRPYHVLRLATGALPRRGAWRNDRTGAAVKLQKLYRLRGPRRALAKAPVVGELVATWDEIQSRPGDLLTVGDGVHAAPLPAREPWAGRRLVGGQRRRVDAALAALGQRDPWVRVEVDRLTGDPILYGLSDLHVDLAADALRATCPELTAATPPVSYRETPRATAREAEGLHAGVEEEDLEELARVVLDLSPAPAEVPASLEWSADEDDLPARFREAVHAGLLDACQAGTAAGYPVVGVAARCTGGAYNALFTTDEHVRLAARAAARQALQRVGTEILEPWSEVELEVPRDAVGSVVGALGAFRGRVLGVDSRIEHATLDVAVPEAELVALRQRLMSLTGGHATCAARRVGYQRLPETLVPRVVATSPVRPPRRVSPVGAGEAAWAGDA